MRMLIPTLVDVRGHDGQVRPALLLAQRADRRFVQVSHAAGDNRLRWVPAADVAEAGDPVASPPPFVAGESGAVALSGPRAGR